MATIQCKPSRGKKYWQIVESRRIDGKPRPVVIQYLGTIENLLKKLKGIDDNFQIKSFSHGAVAALLKTSTELNIVEVLNKYVASDKKYRASKPILNDTTAGFTFLLAAIGRVCHPTSKEGWANWAETTSLSYLTRLNLKKLDSQHFWDMMDSFPCENIEKAENEIILNVLKKFNLTIDSLFFDTTNFFTYIASTNTRCSIAVRGKNKQKRSDLRQVGMALVATREDQIPLFHLTYEGNMNDSKVFSLVVDKIKKRLTGLQLDISNHTIVFDRGMNSKSNLALLSSLNYHYVGALSPSHHKKLVDEIFICFEALKNNNELLTYRTKQSIWGEERTIVAYISDKLKAGQLRGIYDSVKKKMNALKKISDQLNNPKSRKRKRSTLEGQVEKITNNCDLIQYSINSNENQKYTLTYNVDQSKIDALEDELGLRILMTNRHDWTNNQIIDAYHGQAKIEQVFKEIKNPFHLACRPQFHWTDQKIKMHFFICVIGYLLSALIIKQARNSIKYSGNLDSLLSSLSNIRLATLLKQNKKKDKPDVLFKLEQMSNLEGKLLKSLNLDQLHINRPKIQGISVYK